MLYLDHNAASPPEPRVVRAVAEAAERLYGNAASAHQAGRAARRAIEEARAEVARLISASPSEIVFTSGGTEANFLALVGVSPKTLLYSQLEHPSLLKAADVLAQRGTRLRQVSTPQMLTEPNADLVSVMLAQNETGEIFDVAKISRLAHQNKTLVHCDAVQAVGKIAVDVSALGVDLLSLSGHKLGALAGVGALYVRRGTKLSPMMPGLEERGLRAGTMATALIVGFGVAAGLAREERLSAQNRLRALREKLCEIVKEAIPGAKETIQGRPCLPNTAHFLLPLPCDGEELIARLDERGVCASTGAACASGERRPSHVLLAMGCSPEEARASLRLSLGPESTEEEILALRQILPAAYQASREAA